MSNQVLDQFERFQKILDKFEKIVDEFGKLKKLVDQAVENLPEKQPKLREVEA